MHTERDAFEGGGSPASEPGAGISRALAAWRAAHYRDLRYALSLSLAPGFERVQGTLCMHWTMAAPVDLILDWRPHAGGALRKLRVNAQAVRVDIVHDHLVVDAGALRAGENRVELEFEAPVDSARTALTRYHDREDGARYLYSLLVPADASSVFPCVDQPDLKGRFELEVRVPAGNTVIANGPLREHAAEGDCERFRFAPTAPISTYVFAFAAGPFVAFADAGGAQRLFVRRSRQARASAEHAEVMRLNGDAVRYFEALFDRPFPFAKYDLVLLPEFPYGGMEHAGATFLREDAVLFPGEATAADRLRRAQLIFHEASHQWFGDLVTMRWFDDLWLKEGFANLMAMRAAQALLPEFDARNGFRALKVSAYRTDVSAGTTPLWQALPNLSAAKSAYGSIVYSKAPALLHQLSHYVGEAAFIAGVRAFLRAHAFGNADWGDLIAALESASGMSLQAWAEAWVQRPGLPRIDVELQAAGGRIEALALRQRPASAVHVGAAGLRWPQRVTLWTLGPDGATRELDVPLEAERTPVRALDGAPLPRLLFANAHDWGYGLFMLDARSRAAALGMLGTIDDALLRALLWDALWEAVRAGELAPRAWVELALRELPAERDELSVAGLLGNLQTAMRCYLGEPLRAGLQEAVEAMHERGMREAQTVSLRVAWFRSYVALAAGDRAIAMLHALLDGGAQVPGMPLRPVDRFRIVRALLARNDARAQDLPARLRAEDTSDEAHRHAYAAEAARPDAATKARYFDAFLHDATLPERWIEDALAAFNTVEQDALTLPMLAPALKALPRLKRERRIFFVNNWLGAFLGGQRSGPALRVVDDFLARATIDPDLRRKVLEARDALARTVRIRASG